MSNTKVTIDANAIIQLILLYGIPAAIQIIETLSKPDFTLEDLVGLRGLVRLPETYLIA